MLFQVPGEVSIKTWIDSQPAANNQEKDVEAVLVRSMKMSAQCAAAAEREILR